LSAVGKEGKVSKLSQRKLRLAARLFAANVILTSQPSFAFENTELTEDEQDALAEYLDEIGRRLLGKYESIGSPADIIEQVK
jgi:hypothetical protein